MQIPRFGLQPNRTLRFLGPEIPDDPDQTVGELALLRARQGDHRLSTAIHLGGGSNMEFDDAIEPYIEGTDGTDDLC